MICRLDMVHKKVFANRGFILLEVLLAAIIFTIGMAGINAGLVQATRANVSAANITIAADLARQAFEQLKAGQEPENEQTVKCGPAATAFTIHCQVKPHPDNNAMRIVTATVSWQEWGAVKKVDMTTILLPKQFPLAPQPGKR